VQKSPVNTGDLCWLRVVEDVGTTIEAYNEFVSILGLSEQTTNRLDHIDSTEALLALRFAKARVRIKKKIQSLWD
jgi:hypothetical protein